MSEQLLEDLYKMLRFFLSQSKKMPLDSFDKPNVVVLFFELLAVNAKLQIDFIEKVNHEALADVINQDFIPEEALVFLLKKANKRKKWFVNLVPYLHADALWWLMDTLETEGLLNAFRKDELVFSKQHKAGLELLAGVSVHNLWRDLRSQLWDATISLDYFMRTHIQWRSIDDDANKHLLYFFKRNQDAQVLEEIRDEKALLFLLKRLVLVFYPKSLPSEFNVIKKALSGCLRDTFLMKKKPSQVKGFIDKLPSYLIEALLESALQNQFETVPKSLVEELVCESPKVKKCARRKNWDLKMPPPLQLPEALKQKLELLKLELGAY